jgi:hypothetical protein
MPSFHRRKQGMKKQPVSARQLAFDRPEQQRIRAMNGGKQGKPLSPSMKRVSDQPSKSADRKP